MRRTLFLIPHEIGGLPVFGTGWLLILLVMICVGQIAWGLRKKLGLPELAMQLGGWIVAMIVVVFAVPALELRDVHGEPMGVAVRGYGAFLLAAVLSAIGLVLFRARRAGVKEETIFSLVPWLVGGGLIGARAFYVAMNYQQFFQGSPIEILGSILSFTSGGLVVYGSLIGGLVAGIIFCVIYKQSFFRLGDIIVPSLFLGIALGRLGCLMNGCCWGGRCENHWAALHFPPGSPVYEDQLTSGELIGIKLDPVTRTKEGGIVEDVVPNSLAAAQGIQANEHVSLTPVPPSIDELPPGTSQEDYSHLGLKLVSDQHRAVWTAKELPTHALPVAPAQLISSIDALLLCGFLLWIADRLKHRPGVLLCLGFSLYAIIRYCEEIVRVDEPGRFGTTLSIGQWVSIASLIFFTPLMFWLLRQPPLPTVQAKLHGK